MPIKGQSPKQVVKTEMHKWKHGSLHSGSKRGPLVKSQKQAIAIALSEARKARKARGGSIEGDDKDDITYGGTLPKSEQPITRNIPEALTKPPKGIIIHWPSDVTPHFDNYPDQYHYADGGDVDPQDTAEDMASAAEKELANQKNRPSLPDVGEPLIGDGGQFSRGTKLGNEAADIGSIIGGNAVIGTATFPYRYVKGMVDASKYPVGSEEARNLVGDLTGEAGLIMLGSGRGAPNTSGVFVGPYGAFMLRQADRGLTKPHPVYGEEAAQAASQLRPEFRDAYKGWQTDARDAQARQILESRQASGNPYDTDVWRGSGWTRGAEGVPKKEIPDIGAKLVPVTDKEYFKSKFPNKEYPDYFSGGDKVVGYRLDHPAGDLHDIYDVPLIKIDKTLGKGEGTFQPATNQITLGSPKNVSAALHEFQHAIQKKEGFAVPFDPMVSRGPDFHTERFPGQIPSWQMGNASQMIEAGRHPDPEWLARYENYQKSAGEVEPRNVQARRAKSYRYQTHPEDTEDRSRGLQTIDRSWMARPRSAIRIHELDTEGGDNTIPVGEHFLPKYASGGQMGGFNPERAAAYGLAKQGMLHSNVPGRTDKLNLSVPTGSYIIPADIPSALGQGNSMAGSSVLDKMFTKGPYGMNIGKARGGLRTHARSSSLSKIRFADGGDTRNADILRDYMTRPGWQSRMRSQMGDAQSVAFPFPNQQGRARGGKSATPIVAAGGEYVVHPDTVADLGNGDIDLGHNILDAFVKHIRQKHIKTLRGLKPPKGSK